MANWKRVKRLREWLLACQNGICPYCNKPIAEPTIHHRNGSRGYAKSKSDLIVCCEKCHGKINVVSDIFRSANAQLRTELMYQIQVVASSHLTKERSEANPMAQLQGLRMPLYFPLKLYLSLIGRVVSNEV